MERDDGRAGVTERLPLLVLDTAVLFPRGVIGLQVATGRSLALARAVDEGPGVLAIFGLRDREVEEPSRADQLAPVGVVAEVVQVLRLGPDREQLFLHGLERVELLGLEQTEPFMVGRVARVPAPETLGRLEMDVLIGKTVAAFEELAAVDDRYAGEALELVRMNVDQGPGTLSDLAASQLHVPVEEKQRLVEMLDPVDRLRFLLELVEREIARVAVDRDVKAQVRSDLEDRKREMILREQLRVIRRSLGEEHGPQREAEVYARRVADLPIEEEHKRVLLKECDRLALLTESAAEYPMLHSYFETVFGLPWNERTRDKLSLPTVDRFLDRNHHGVSEVKERILEYLAVAKLKQGLAGPILCLAGPPGVGKTTIARSIADAMGRRFLRLSLGGVSDESEIRGHRKTYVGAMPGKIVSAYLQVGARNPLILLDELDKLSSHFRGDPAAALLEVLDPQQNAAFNDRYLGIPWDLSETLFVATANRLDTIPGPLLDRLEVISLSGYTVEEKVTIARKHVVPAALEEHGLPRGALAIDGEALTQIVRLYTSEAGVRDLSRRIAAICRKVARRRVGKRPPKRVRVRAVDVERFLGPPVYEHEFAERSPEVGVATGLAWTGAGGEILFIEAARMSGTGKIEVTGHLGEVMRESVQAAYSYVRSRAKELEIPSEAFDRRDIHIHFPAGAIPKDGPSAGVAVATCLASLLSGKPVRHDVAMTGEITLRGRVLSVGGIKEKVLAAHRAQIKTVLLPPGNKKDLVDVPEEALRDLQIVFTPRVEDVWREALMPILVVRQQDLSRFEKGDYSEVERRGA